MDNNAELNKGVHEGTLEGLCTEVHAGITENSKEELDIKTGIRTIVDFPSEGILFRDITTLLQEPVYLKAAIEKMQKLTEGMEFDLIVGPESRGFIFGMPLAYNLGKGFIPIRKKGKLPHKTMSKTYDLEYGSATIEIHEDAIQRGQRVVVVDDLLATGGTSKAITDLITEMGGVVSGLVFLIELESLKGRDVLKDFVCQSVVQY